MIRHALTSHVSPLGWMFTALGVICLASFPWVGWHELLACAIMALAMLCAAGILTLGNTRVQVTITASERRVTAGDPVHIVLDVSNPGIRPTVGAHAELQAGGTRRGFAIPPLAAGQSRRIELTINTVARAALTVGPLRIGKGDPLGLVRREQQVAERITVFVHPAIVALDTVKAGMPRDLEGLPSGRIVDDDLDFHGLREYAAGDDMRNVHWLSSAKTGVPMIRQYESTRRTDTSITLATDPHGYVSAEEFEMAVSAHASVGAACLDRHRMVSAHAGSRHARYDGVMAFLDEVSAITPDATDDTVLAADMLRQSPNASWYCFTVGSLISLNTIRRMVMTLPKSAGCMVLQANVGAESGVTRLDGFILAVIGRLDDLPHVMEVFA